MPTTRSRKAAEELAAKRPRRSVTAKASTIAETSKTSRTRVKKTNRTPTARKESSEDTTDGEDESDWDYAPKKRKRQKTSSKVQSKKKDNRKQLPSIFSLPMELRLEIFSWLGPQDLLTISRTSKEHRRMVMQPSSKALWKVARLNEGIPDPAPGWSEPRWATLLFGGSRCEVCSVPGVQVVDFGILRRVCTGCKKEHLVFTQKFRKEYTEYDDILLDMLPWTHYGGWSVSEGRFYWHDDIIEIGKQWASLQDNIHRRQPYARELAQEFLESRKTLVQGITDNVMNGRAWQNQHLNLLREQRRDAKRRRLEEIKRRFKELGYLDNDMHVLDRDQVVDVPRELTERIWKRIRPILEPQIQRWRRRRITGSRERMFENVFDDYVKAMPTSRWNTHRPFWHVLAFEPIEALINAEWDVDVTREDLLRVTPMIPEGVRSWEEKTRADLQEQILEFRNQRAKENSTTATGATTTSSSSSVESTLSVDPLKLAIAVFVCSCRSGVWSDTIASVWFGWAGVELHACTGTFRRDCGYPSKTTQSFKISPCGYTTGEDLVKDAGLNPETATIEDMDKVVGEYRYCCLTCPSKQLVHDWRGVVAHAVSQHHCGTPLTWRRLTEVERKSVFSTSTPKFRDCRWACGHCKVHFQNLTTMFIVERHIEEKHGISDPVEGKDKIYFPSRLTYHPILEERRVLSS